VTEMTESAELAIPESASAAMFSIESDWEDDTELFGAIRLIAAPVVAAELRRIADEHHVSDERARIELVDAKQAGRLRDSDMWFGRSIALEATVELLRARADELDPPATEED
jgi:hypothetical protein